jgi:hypothetical protein
MHNYKSIDKQQLFIINYHQQKSLDPGSKAYRDDDSFNV